MQIQAINNYHLNQINFESKQKNQAEAPAHATTPLKSIPVALLIAMSPVKAPMVKAQAPATRTEVITAYEDEDEDFEDTEKVIQFSFDNAMKDGRPCRITVYNSVENGRTVKLHFDTQIKAYAMTVDGDIVDAYRNREIDISPEELFSETEVRDNMKGGKKIETKYYVIGSGREFTEPPRPIDGSVKTKEVTQPIDAKVKHRKYEVSQKLFEYLREILIDNIPVREEEKSTLIIGPLR